MIDKAVTVLIVTAALWGALFMIGYVRRRPWRTLGGRLVLGFMGVIALTLALAVIYRFTGPSPAWRWARLASWSLINVIMAGAVLALWRSGRSEGSAVDPLSTSSPQPVDGEL